MAMKLLPESEGYAVVAGSIQQLSEELGFVAQTYL